MKILADTVCAQPWNNKGFLQVAEKRMLYRKVWADPVQREEHQRTRDAGGEWNTAWTQTRVALAGQVRMQPGDVFSGSRESCEV